MEQLRSYEQYDQEARTPAPEMHTCPIPLDPHYGGQDQPFGDQTIAPEGVVPLGNAETAPPGNDAMHQQLPGSRMDEGDDVPQARGGTTVRPEGDYVAVPDEGGHADSACGKAAQRGRTCPQKKLPQQRGGERIDVIGPGRPIIHRGRSYHIRSGEADLPTPYKLHERDICAVLWCII